MGTDLPMELLLPLVGRAGRVADVVGAWLLTYALHSTVLLLAAWALVAAMRGRWSPAAEAAIWRSALVAGWVTASVQLAAPWRPLAGQFFVPGPARGALTAVRVESTKRAVQRMAAPARDVAPASARPTGARTVEGAPFAGPGGAEVRRVLVVAISFATIAVAGWAAIAALSAAHLAALRRRLRVAIAGRQDARESLAGNALRHLQRQAGVTRPVALAVSDVLAVPAALPGAEIVLPVRAVRELTLPEQEGVLAHELAHVVRRDTFWLQLATWIERVAWFQPLNRVARRQMQCAAEFAADAWAVRITGEPLRLAQALARVASWRRAGAPGTAYASALGADGSPLVDRVRRLTAPGGVATSALGGSTACGAMGAVAALALLALPQVVLGRPAHPRASAEQRVELHLSDRIGAREAAAWRESEDASVRLVAPGAVPRHAPSSGSEVATLLRRVATPGAGAVPPASAGRTFILVRRKGGTAS